MACRPLPPGRFQKLRWELPCKHLPLKENPTEEARLLNTFSEFLQRIGEQIHRHPHIFEYPPKLRYAPKPSSLRVITQQNAHIRIAPGRSFIPDKRTEQQDTQDVIPACGKLSCDGPETASYFLTVQPKNRHRTVRFLPHT